MIVRPYYTLFEELKSDAGTAGGGASGDDLNVDIAAVSDEIGAGLGLGDDTTTTDLDEDKGAAAKSKDGSASSPPPAKGQAAAPAETARLAAERAGKIAAAKAELATKKVDYTGKTDDEILALAAPAAPTAPKSWKKELHDHFGKLPPEVQSYITQREAEVEEGFKAYAARTRYGEEMHAAFQPYEALLTAQGVKDHTFALKTLMNAHYILSTEPAEGRANFMLGLLKNYGVDLAALNAVAANVEQPAAESAAVKELRLRTERLENERRTELSSRVAALKAESAAEVEAFASDPKHPYFNEVAREVTLLLQDPNVSLARAYESAVWANPVTRAKEQARLQAESGAAAQKAADEAAQAAEKARGTRVRGSALERESPDPLGSMDETIRSTFREIKTRQEG